ncbi:MAG: hypothetical protein KIS92_20040 [Planctomycetota bacterium]|nr:hypothetical protein [Planctomycetota bacterium]
MPKKKTKTGPASFARVAEVVSGVPASKPAVVAGPYSGTSAPAALPDPCLTPVNAEERELCEAAVRAVLATVRAARASGKYGPFDWLKESERLQVEHAFGHVRELESLYDGYKMRQPDEDHAAHLLTRATLLQALVSRRITSDE